MIFKRGPCSPVILTVTKESTMNPIFDTALLKHHRVVYAPRIDRDGVKRSAGTRKFVAQTLITLFAIGVVTGMTALS